MFWVQFVVCSTFYQQDNEITTGLILITFGGRLKQRREKKTIYFGANQNHGSGRNVASPLLLQDLELSICAAFV